MEDPFLAALDQATRTVVARVRGQLPPAATTTAGTITGSHYYCCDQDLALCGLDLTGFPFESGDAGEAGCDVCAVLHMTGLKCRPLCPSDPYAT